MATETQTPVLAPGAFCWVDLGTTDPAAARKFYGALFGWTATEYPMPGEAGETYAMMEKDGRRVGGIMQLPEMAKQMGAPPNWLSHVWVKSAADTAKKVKELGGKVFVEPMDCMGEGTMTVLQDPQGAVFAAWQPAKDLGNALYNQPGALCWNELWTSDTNGAKDFYTKLFHWTPDPQKFGDFDYTVLKNGERGNGGMMTMPEDAKKAGAPPSWVVYFAVANCDESVKKVTELGGKIVAPTMEIPTVGRFAVLSDPQGAVFAVIQPEEKK